MVSRKKMIKKSGKKNNKTRKYYEKHAYIYMLANPNKVENNPTGTRKHFLN